MTALLLALTFILGLVIGWVFGVHFAAKNMAEAIRRNRASQSAVEQELGR